MFILTSGRPDFFEEPPAAGPAGSPYRKPRNSFPRKSSSRNFKNSIVTVLNTFDSARGLIALPDGNFRSGEKRAPGERNEIEETNEGQCMHLDSGNCRADRTEHSCGGCDALGFGTGPIAGTAARTGQGREKKVRSEMG